MFIPHFYMMYVHCASDHTIKVWSLEGFAESHEGLPKKLSSLSTVAAHDKDINSVAVAPNDSLLCTGSQVSIDNC